MMMNVVLGRASRLASLPLLKHLSRGANRALPQEDLDGYLAAQRLAQKAVREVVALAGEGMNERQLADLLDTYLRDSGVRSFFHKSFVWIGERTRFEGVRTYFDYLPTVRVLRPGEVFILDVAPIVNGYICDIGFTASLGDNPELSKAQLFLAQLHKELPRLFAEKSAKGGDVWKMIHDQITAAGYDNIHSQYPFSVLGHRVHQVHASSPHFSFINFGWQSYWEFLSRGLFGQLLNENFEGDLTGLWALEPHIGTPTFGAKFEELLLVENGTARWLGP